jgi:hypothetical protein
MAHTGGLCIVDPPFAVARGSGTDAGVSEDIGDGGEEGK